MSGIRQTANYLTDLLREAEKGRLIPAAFQRPVVWGASDVEAFYTSLLRGFPVGAFLVWTPPADVDLSGIGRPRLGPVLADPDGNCAIILDGQNRLASYAWSLADPEAMDDPAAFEAGLAGAAPLSPAERETWLSGRFLAADPVERRVRFHPRSEAAERLLVPASVVASTSRLNPFIRAWEKAHGEIPDDQHAWLVDVVNRRILEARVTVTNLEGLSPADALDAFRHIARAGVPMSERDFEDAMAFAFPDDAPRP